MTWWNKVLKLDDDVLMVLIAVLLGSILTGVIWW